MWILRSPTGHAFVIKGSRYWPLTVDGWALPRA